MTYTELEKRVIDSLKDLYEPAEARAIQRFLFSCFTGLEPAGYLLLRKEEAGKDFEEKVNLAIHQLSGFMPVQYVTGITWFCGFKLIVKQGVLIPRPETEELVMEIVARFRQNKGLTVLDIGTGSGAIAVSLYLMLDEPIVTATDISEDALNVARENSVLNHARVNFIQSDILKKSEWCGFGKYKLIVSNPPYVKQSERILMRSNVLDYEPETALFVEDSNPLLFYRAIAEFALLHLESDGELWLEINETEGENIVFVLNELGFSQVQIHQDMNARSRFVSSLYNANN